MPTPTPHVHTVSGIFSQKAYIQCRSSFSVGKMRKPSAVRLDAQQAIHSAELLMDWLLPGGRSLVPYHRTEQCVLLQHKGNVEVMFTKKVDDKIMWETIKIRMYIYKKMFSWHWLKNKPKTKGTTFNKNKCQVSLLDLQNQLQKNIRWEAWLQHTFWRSQELLIITPAFYMLTVCHSIWVKSVT